MTQETPAGARLSRAIKHDACRYQRALKAAKCMSVEALQEAAAHLLVLAMRERAFHDRSVEVRENADRSDASGLEAELSLHRFVSEIKRIRRAKGGQATAAKLASARAEVRAAWAKANKRGRGTKKLFDFDQAKKHGVDPRTIERWRR